MAAEQAANWDLTAIYPGLNSNEFRQFRAELSSQITSLAGLVTASKGITADELAHWAQIASRLESIQLDLDHLQSFAICWYTEYPADPLSLDEYRRAMELASQVDRLIQSLHTAIWNTDQITVDRLLASKLLSTACYYLQRMKSRAPAATSTADDHEAAQSLDTELFAWESQYRKISNDLVMDVEFPDGERRRIPIAHRRQLYADQDHRVRDAAFAGVGKAWRSIDVSAAACLNDISHSRISMADGSKSDAVFADTLFENRISRETVEGVVAAAEEINPTIRGFLRTKAAILGKKKCGFQDLSIGLQRQSNGNAARSPLDVIDCFQTRLPQLARSCRRVFDKNWIKLSPNGSGNFGDYCAPFPKINEARVIVGYAGSLFDQNTLSHELGHAFHAELLNGLRFWLQTIPTTLAETASTVAEGLFRKSYREKRAGNAEESAELLVLELNKAVTYLALSPSYFDFERQLYDRRGNGELETDELDGLMRQSQMKWFGDSIAEENYEPHGWIANHLFYDSRRAFYNFPYSFGYLLSRLIVERLDEQGFDRKYEGFLQASGSDSVEHLCRDWLGIDLQDPHVWQPVAQCLKDDLNALRGYVRDMNSGGSDAVNTRP